MRLSLPSNRRRISGNNQRMSDKKSILLRINKDLWDELSSWAEDELRSLNGQIEYILREEVTKRKKGRSKRKDSD